MAIKEQEITTRAVRKAREKDPQKKAALSPVCRLCHQKEENMFQIVCSCTELSSSMYPPIRHNPIAKNIYHEIMEVIEPGRKRQNGEPPPVTKSGNYGIWWEKVIPTSSSTIDQIFYSGTIKNKSTLLLKSQCRLIQMSQQEQATRKKYTWNLLKRSEYYTQGTSIEQSQLW